MKNLPRIQESLAPNLIPMIDIMFLLLLFFMLGADMGQRSLEEVRLPLASSAQHEPPRAAPEPRVTINAHRRTDAACPDYGRRRTCRDPGHWKLAIRGKDVTGQDALAAALEVETAGSRHVDAQGLLVSDRRVMIRADASAPYALAQRAMKVCAEQGIYRIEVGAAKPAAR
jgi:biopolymer transport protein ExbD